MANQLKYSWILYWSLIQIVPILALESSFRELNRLNQNSSVNFGSPVGNSEDTSSDIRFCSSRRTIQAITNEYGKLTDCIHMGLNSSQLAEEDFNAYQQITDFCILIDHITYCVNNFTQHWLWEHRCLKTINFQWINKLMKLIVATGSFFCQPNAGQKLLSTIHFSGWHLFKSALFIFYVGVAAFIADMGVECLQSRQFGLQRCFQVDSNSFQRSSSRQILAVFLATAVRQNSCHEMEKTKTCIGLELKQCDNPTLLIIMEQFFQVFTEEMQCAFRNNGSTPLIYLHQVDVLSIIIATVLLIILL